MNRRTFTKSLALSAAALGFGSIPAFANKPAAPQFSNATSQSSTHSKKTPSKQLCSLSAATLTTTKENNCSRRGTRPVT
jgi:hypothetical protein